MYVRVYKYTVPKKNHKKWSKVYEEAVSIYHEAGLVCKHYEREEGSSLHITELITDSSREQYRIHAEQIDADPRIIKLYEKFLTLIEGDVSEDEYETLSCAADAQ